MGNRDVISTLHECIMLNVASVSTPAAVAQLGCTCRSLHAVTEGMLSVAVQHLTHDERTEQLLVAAGSRATTYCRILLEHGAEANADDSSPLIAAAGCGDLELCRMLLEGQANAQANARYSDALRLAARNGHVRVCRLLLQHGAGVASAGGDGRMATLDQMRVLLSMIALNTGARVTPAPGVDALVEAARNGHLDVCRVLLKHEVPEIARISDALVAASQNGHTEACRLLLQRGARVHSHYNRAILVEARKGCRQVCHVLLEIAQAGGRLSAPDRHLSPHPHAAARQGACQRPCQRRPLRWQCRS
jgi:ankyrin repeat protein